MSHNPTYLNDMDTSGNNLDLEERPEYYPSKPNMASYRAATSDPSVPVYQPGRSYRHATENIPEDADEPDGYTPDDARHVDFTTPSNGGGMSKKPTASSSSSSSRTLLIILGALAVLFFILALIFIILYATKSTDSTPDVQASTESIKGKTTVVEPTYPPTTMGSTSKPPSSISIGNHKLYYLREGGIEVELFSLGARVNAFRVDGTDVVAGFNISSPGFDTNLLTEYAFGAANGRVCSAIKTYTIERGGARVDQQGAVDAADPSSGKNTNSGLFQLAFSDQTELDGSVTFTRKVGQSDDGVPGNAEIKINYKLDADEKKLIVTRSARSLSNVNSLIDLCNSMRFNLNGDASDVISTNMMVNANYFIRNDDFNEFEGAYSGFDYATAKDLTDAETLAKLSGTNANLEVFYYIRGPEHTSGGLNKAVELSIPNGKKLEIWTSNSIAKVFVPISANAPTIPGRVPYGRSSYISVVTHNYPNGPALTGWQSTMWFPNGAEYQSIDAYRVI